MLDFTAAVASSLAANYIYDRLKDPDKVSTPSTYGKDIGNLFYHSAVIGSFSIGYSLIAKKIVKIKPADLGRLDLEDGAKLIGTVALSLWTQDMLVKWGWLPSSMIK